MRRIAFPLAAVVAGTLVVVIAGEIAVRFAGVHAAPLRYFRPGIYRSDRELGWGLAPDYAGVHVERTSETPTTTNALGYRSLYWDATRAAPAVRVLALGDSCTFGRGVGDDETWPARLEARLRVAGVDAAVFDAGVPGYDTVQEEVVFDRLLPLVRPTHVVVAWLPNDALERSAEMRHSVQVIDGQLIDDIEHYGDWKAQVDGLGISGSALYRFVRVEIKLARRAMAPRHAIGDRFDISNEALGYSQAPLGRIAARAHAVGARPILLLLPREEEVEPPLPREDHYARMAAFAREQHIDVIDLPDAWRSSGGLPAGELYLPQDEVHFTPRGYDVIAEAVAARVREHP